MLRFETAENPGQWKGSCWFVENEDLLSEMIARVALGQSHHVQEILKNTGCEQIASQVSLLQGAVKLLTVKNPSQPYHRDGWLFQTISWIVSHFSHPELLKSAPHMIHAHKGFDALQVGLSSSEETVNFVFICEDKATENPRNMLTSQVWPEIRNLEKGERDNELVAEVVTIVNSNSQINGRLAVSKIFWEKARRYRVALATDEDLSTPRSRAELFRGFEEFPQNGVPEQRQAELLLHGNLRAWFDKLASDAIGHAQRLTASTNV